MASLIGRFNSLPPRIARLLVLVVVVNIALGVSVSVVALNSAVDTANSQVVSMAQLLTQAERESGIEWQMYYDTAHPPRDLAASLIHASSLYHSLSGPSGSNQIWTVDLNNAYLSYQSSIRQIAGNLADGRIGIALKELDTTASPLLGRLRSDLGRAELAQEVASHRTSLVADAETIVMMLFAAILGSLLFQSFSAARLKGVLEAAEERSKAQARFKTLVENSHDVLVVLDKDLRALYLTPSLERTLGWTISEIVGRPLLELVCEDDRTAMLASIDGSTANSSGELCVSWNHRNGSVRFMESVITNLLDDPNVGAIVLNARDITERRQLEDQLVHSAFHDPLTELANRALFEERVASALKRAEAGDSVSILFIDLDDFKSVNDTLGHSAGDELLVQVSDRLLEICGKGDVVARLAGDEFAVLLEDLGGRESAVIAGEAITESLARPYTLSAGEWVLLASVGAASGAEAGVSVDSLLRDADIAMYVAKQQGKACFAIFDPEMHEKFVERIRLKADIQTALERQEFFVVYQPVVDLENGAIVGVEALVRWTHPELGLLPPLLFVPLAEESGLVVEMGKFVLRTACMQLAEWNRYQPNSCLTLNVNASLRELAEPDFVTSVQNSLLESGLEPNLLTIELTETLLMSSPEAFVPTLDALHAIGVRIAIDDFGTGYSSLSYLENLPIDSLKIDKSFTDHLMAGEVPVTLRTIVQLGNELQLKIVAEGIEEAVQVTSLMEIGCLYGQGFHFDRPLSAEDLRKKFLPETKRSDEYGVVDPHRRFGVARSEMVYDSVVRRTDKNCKE